MFEEKPFDEGTVGIAQAVAEAADSGATVIVGGGDSVAAVTQAGVADRITHISTGGGATLEFLAGDELPGVADRITHISTGGGATLEFLAGDELPGVAALNEK